MHLSNNLSSLSSTGKAQIFTLHDVGWELQNQVLPQIVSSLVLVPSFMLQEPPNLS